MEVNLDRDLPKKHTLGQLMIGHQLKYIILLAARVASRWAEVSLMGLHLRTLPTQSARLLYHLRAIVILRLLTTSSLLLRSIPIISNRRYKCSTMALNSNSRATTILSLFSNPEHLCLTQDRKILKHLDKELNQETTVVLQQISHL